MPDIHQIILCCSEKDYSSSHIFKVNIEKLREKIRKRDLEEIITQLSDIFPYISPNDEIIFRNWIKFHNFLDKALSSDEIASLISAIRIAPTSLISRQSKKDILNILGHPM